MFIYIDIEVTQDCTEAGGEGILWISLLQAINGARFDPVGK